MNKDDSPTKQVSVEEEKRKERRQIPVLNFHLSINRMIILMFQETQEIKDKVYGQKHKVVNK